MSVALKERKKLLKRKKRIELSLLWKEITKKITIKKQNLSDKSAY